MAKTILFVGTPYMGLHEDIITEMRSQGYVVDFLEEINSAKDPLNVRGYKGIKKWLYVNAEKYEKQMASYWVETLNKAPYNKAYDFLFVLDGQSLRKCLFDILKKRNPEFKSVNYMFDTTNGVYRFDANFKYFDKVVTFDRHEAEKYHIHLMPIYWLPVVAPMTCSYKFFGMGAYKKDRFQLFQAVADFAKKHNQPYFIRLKVYEYKFLELKYTIRKIFGLHKNYMSPAENNSEIAMHGNLPLSEFQMLLNESEIILDTNAPHQDGLTARFMQALGSEKKIITTNEAAALYDFYTPEQIYIVKDIYAIANEISFQKFVANRLNINQSTRDSISLSRIDNWVKYMLDF